MFFKDYQAVVIELLSNVAQLGGHKKSKKQNQEDSTLNLMRRNEDPEVCFVRKYRDKPVYVNNHAEAVMRTLG